MQYVHLKVGVDLTSMFRVKASSSIENLPNIENLLSRLLQELIFEQTGKVPTSGDTEFNGIVPNFTNTVETKVE